MSAESEELPPQLAAAPRRGGLRTTLWAPIGEISELVAGMRVRNRRTHKEWQVVRVSTLGVALKQEVPLINTRLTGWLLKVPPNRPVLVKSLEQLMSVHELPDVLLYRGNQETKPYQLALSDGALCAVRFEHIAINRQEEWQKSAASFAVSPP